MTTDHLAVMASPNGCMHYLMCGLPYTEWCVACHAPNGAWCPREESNLGLKLRRLLFYPLNYGGKIKLILQKYFYQKIKL